MTIDKPTPGEIEHYGTTPEKRLIEAMKQEYEKLKNEYEAYRISACEVISTLANYFWCEMDWENFRAGFLSRDNKRYATTREQNAQEIAKFMQQAAIDHPEWAEALKMPRPEIPYLSYPNE